MTGETSLFAVAGHPVLHSLSPLMHEAGFAQLGLKARYVRLAPDSAEEALSLAREIGLQGFNVTAPFKADMYALVDETDEDARKIGAVNTVLLREGRTVGCNTDVYGVAQALRANGVEIAGRKALVLGTGGAAAAAVCALAAHGASVTVAGRDAAKATALAERFAGASCPLGDCGQLASAARACDILVDCTGADTRLVPPESLSPGATVLTAAYSRPTPLAADAAKAGCRVLCGREWLLYQGGRAFELFTGRTAPVEAMRQALRGVPERSEKRSLALVGFMGSGKSAVARELAQETGLPLASVDGEVERSAGVTVRQIFESRGEAEFRKMEAEALRELVSRGARILDCGGGAVLNEANRSRLRTCGTVVWLWAHPSTLTRRLPQDGTRPLLNVPDRAGRIADLLRQRLDAYAATSDLVIGTEGRTESEVARRILDETH